MKNTEIMENVENGEVIKETVEETVKTSTNVLATGGAVVMGLMVGFLGYKGYKAIKATIAKRQETTEDCFEDDFDNDCNVEE